MRSQSRLPWGNSRVWRGPGARLLPFVLLGSLVGVHGCPPPTEAESPARYWVAVSWSGGATELELSEPSNGLGGILELYAERFVPEALFGGADIRTILELDEDGDVVGVHTTTAVNRQWVEERLPISDVFFLSNARTNALPLASPASGARGGAVEVEDAIVGLSQWGPVQVEIETNFSGLRLASPASGTVTVSATFTTVAAVPSAVLFGFSGLEAGDVVTYRYAVPVLYRPTVSPENDDYRRTSVIVAPAGTLPRELGWHGSDTARRLEALGLL